MPYSFIPAAIRTAERSFRRNLIIKASRLPSSALCDRNFRAGGIIFNFAFIATLCLLGGLLVFLIFTPKMPMIAIVVVALVFLLTSWGFFLMRKLNVAIDDGLVIKSVWQAKEELSLYSLDKIVISDYQFRLVSANGRELRFSALVEDAHILLAILMRHTRRLE